ncbi:hypothetical protein A3E06_00190 [Candidatus Giovannonibacteria bacterium RIFCSPHIGHO2_12_FULL_44_42]|nr:MAG: hypothetical protein A3E06_00190 [Candidatus Giovannonibacteria bacterium RIFCSPHIGHO2_12_FULL_44_42]OGF89989.1 MAG: hypothetical protein A3I94_04250 [Candidatus Giovannonibacteria bacterium RIFCSPLOWO2_02_FULL_43_54]OGF97102.1 MAG: hypothetical protein A3H08_02505 [Candidatus Giovannonibacteria bacterium RIFCSPLOWO2_12_FULL_44_32]HLD34741.1 SemiSWEET family transporter [Patescibacteria group bacterium]
MFEIIRWSTLLSTALMAGVGYSDQIRLIWTQHSTSGLSFWMVLIAFWSWLSYALYGYYNKDRKMFWPNLAGLITISVILASFFIF